jgi:allantoinase
VEQNSSFDLLIKGATIVQPGATETFQGDIAIQGGVFSQIAHYISSEAARTVVDAHGLLAFPGVVDAHMHTGIYAPLDADARSESAAAAAGGVTSSLNYIRTGKYYLNQGGPYRLFMPQVQRLSQGNYYVDYGYHVAPMDPQHIEEMELLLKQFGVASFKIFMFYGTHGLHGCSNAQHEFLMTSEEDPYDYAHFEMVMRRLAELNQQNPELQDSLSLSLHCETGEIMRAYTKLVLTNTSLTGLRAYSASRPPHSEGLAVFVAAYLANETDCPNINLLHLSSRKAFEAAMLMKGVFPHINFKREVTIGHLLLDVDSPAGAYAKVNPPIRERSDVEYLWQELLKGNVDWVVSDHACCSEEIKVHSTEPGNIFLAKSGFGGTEYLLPGLLTEGRKRKLSLNRMAELLCYNPARRFGLPNKGDIAPGLDADLVLVDPDANYIVEPADSPSGQQYSPFANMQLTAKVRKTFLRGQLIYDNGTIVGSPQGQYLQRPQAPRNPAGTHAKAANIAARSARRSF